MLVPTALILGFLGLSVEISAAPAPAPAPAPAQYDRDCNGKLPYTFYNATHWWVPGTVYFGPNKHAGPEDNTCGIYYRPEVVEGPPRRTVARTYWPDGRRY
jgi:hypothetical protein